MECVDRCGDGRHVINANANANGHRCADTCPIVITDCGAVRNSHDVAEPCVSDNPHANSESGRWRPHQPTHVHRHGQGFASTYGNVRTVAGCTHRGDSRRWSEVRHQRIPGEVNPDLSHPRRNPHDG